MGAYIAAATINGGTQNKAGIKEKTQGATIENLLLASRGLLLRLDDLLDDLGLLDQECTNNSVWEGEENEHSNTGQEYQRRQDGRKA